MSFENKTIFITGASRGIGKAIALKLAQHGANIVVVAKSVKEDPRLGGTIYSAAEEIQAAGGKALAVQCDIRDEEQVIRAVQEAISVFGSIDVLINNASAISLSNTEHTDMKRFGLMHDINVKGTFMVTKHCIPFLEKSDNPHILTLSPPLNMNPQWFGQHVAYTISKYNMSMLAMGWAEELKQYKIASNTLWPATTIGTAAIRNLLGGEMIVQHSRKPEIIADAAYYILQQASDSYTGKFLIDEEVLKEAGVTNFDDYAIVPGKPLQKDLFLD
ncbi:MAG: NAD(P)-dependent oxidoreductase [Sphingobacteriales bacterium]|nr:MAG: NAD(P)-dependent oxidoreductase [Sphingobacteriales bacterium]